jgi:hypothetical protein
MAAGTRETAATEPRLLNRRCWSKVEEEVGDGIVEGGSEKVSESVSLLSRKFGPRESAANYARLLRKKRYRSGTVINASFARVFKLGNPLGSWAQLFESTSTGQFLSS